MNTKILVAALVLAGLAGQPALADALGESIRDQGREAIAGIQAEIRDGLRASPEPKAYTVDEAIREQGRRALASIVRELEHALQEGSLNVAGGVPAPAESSRVTVSAGQPRMPLSSESM